MKHSTFNLNEQNQKIESRIVVALERISEAFRVLLWNESKENSLSPIQIQILIFIHFHDLEKCKVGYLADEFNMTKATISDSVRVLLSKELVTKETDPIDTRSYTLSLTDEGKKSSQKKHHSLLLPLSNPLKN
ncbi:MarR family winged helix-turn-helix transcriptional regulator [Algoriphagus boritolerans]|uniref:MarR family winged helix-turn-helix transcriptional regulator n=1 Tax=Algoriphagus boritolerans TaxID=308111 RepID=UPI000A9AAAC7